MEVQYVFVGVVFIFDRIIEKIERETCNDISSPNGTFEKREVISLRKSLFCTNDL